MSAQERTRRTKRANSREFVPITVASTKVGQTMDREVRKLCMAGRTVNPRLMSHNMVDSACLAVKFAYYRYWG